MADVRENKPETPETPDASPASEPEKLVEQSVIPTKKRSSKWWYAALIIIVLAAGYYSYTSIFSTPETTAPASPATGAAAGTPNPTPTATTTPAQTTPTPETTTTETTPPSTTTPAVTCSDNNICTLDFFDTVTNACINTPVSNCCGNNICEPGERCTTVCEGDDCTTTKQQTACKQDCPLSCPATLAVHRQATVYQDKSVQNPKTFTCEAANCEQLDDAEFKLTGAASLKTYITNLGEQASDIVTSQFNCNYESPQYNEPAATTDGTVLGRLDQKIRVLDYFNGDRVKQEAGSLSAQQSVGGQTATYSFAVEPVDAKYSTVLSCTVWLRSGDFTNKQDLKIRYVPA
jgi:hypothetical protein